MAREIDNLTREIDDSTREIDDSTREIVNLTREIANLTREIMENLTSQLTLISVLAIVSIVFLPIYLMRRKMRKMTDDDLKKIDLEDWKKQIKSNAYVKLISRNLWGLFLTGAVIYNCWKVGGGINLVTVLTFVIGIIFIIWGFLGYRNEMKKL